MGHVGDGNIHPQIALNLENEEEFKNYINAKSEMYETALKLKRNNLSRTWYWNRKTILFRKYYR